MARPGVGRYRAGWATTTGVEVLSVLAAIQSAISDEGGVTTTQYALFAALIAIVAMAAAVFLGTELNERLSR